MGAASSKRRRTPPPARPPSSREGAQGNHNPGPLKFTIHSVHDQSREVQNRIIQQIEKFSYSEKLMFAIRLALEEAMINAIKHGNKNDATKKVHVEAKVDGGQAEISIEDEGPGFNRSSVPDPTADENLCKCSGRGILLIESYMDSVSWSKGGRRMTMIKRNAT